MRVYKRVRAAATQRRRNAPKSARTVAMPLLAAIGGQLAGAPPTYGLPMQYHVRARSAWRAAPGRRATISQPNDAQLFERYALVWLVKPHGGWKVAVESQVVNAKRPLDGEPEVRNVLQNEDDLMIADAIIKPGDPYVATYMREVAATTQLVDLDVEWFTRRVQPVYRLKGAVTPAQRAIGMRPGGLWSSLDSVFLMNFEKPSYAIVGDGGASYTWQNVGFTGMPNKPLVRQPTLRDPPKVQRRVAKKAAPQPPQPARPIDLAALPALGERVIAAVQPAFRVEKTSSRSAASLLALVDGGNDRNVVALRLDAAAPHKILDDTPPLDLTLANIYDATADGENIILCLTHDVFARAERFVFPGAAQDAVWQVRTTPANSHSRSILVLAENRYLAYGLGQCHAVTYTAATRQFGVKMVAKREDFGRSIAAVLDETHFVYGTGDGIKLYDVDADNTRGKILLGNKSVLAVAAFSGGLIYVLKDDLTIGMARTQRAPDGTLAVDGGEAIGTLRSAQRAQLAWAKSGTSLRQGLDARDTLSHVHIAMMDDDRFVVSYGHDSDAHYYREGQAAMLHPEQYAHYVLWSAAQRRPIAAARWDDQEYTRPAPTWIRGSRSVVVGRADTLVALDAPERTDEERVSMISFRAMLAALRGEQVPILDDVDADSDDDGGDGEENSDSEAGSDGADSDGGGGSGSDSDSDSDMDDEQDGRDARADSSDDEIAAAPIDACVMCGRDAPRGEPACDAACRRSYDEQREHAHAHAHAHA